MKKFWIIFLSIIIGIILFINITPAYAETLHPVTIEWYYDDTYYYEYSGDLINGAAGTKFNSVNLEQPNGLFDFSDYVNNPKGATLYRMYGISPIIRMNGKYYLLMSKYVETNSEYDDVANTIDLSDADTDIVIKLTYNQVPQVSQQKLDKIKVSIDGSANENLISENHYQAYQIFHVTKSKDIVEDVTTDETVGKTISGEDTGFAYYIKESDEWYSVVSQMTDWFKLEETVEEGTYIVSLADGVPAEESTAIAIAEYLEQHIDGKTAIDIISNEARLDIDPGYYLIVSPINSNLILATTNIDITEKAFYPTIEKTVANEDKNSALGEDIHFTSEIFIPKGSKAEMIITDKMTEGLSFKTDSLNMNYNIDYNFQQTDDGFIITIPANEVKSLAQNDNITLVLEYNCYLNENAIVAPRDDETIEGNVNEIILEYVNYIQTSSVDVDTTQFVLLKYAADDENKTPMGGAKFNLYDENNELVQLYEIKPNEEYRLATPDDASSMTELTTVANKTILIWGLDADINYTLEEIKAPDGYNKLTSNLTIEPTDDLGLIVEVPNSAGTLLPSTGDIGTTIFYLTGGIMMVGSAIAMRLKRNKK